MMETDDGRGYDLACAIREACKEAGVGVWLGGELRDTTEIALTRLGTLLPSAVRRYPALRADWDSRGRNSHLGRFLTGILPSEAVRVTKRGFLVMRPGFPRQCESDLESDREPDAELTQGARSRILANAVLQALHDQDVGCWEGKLLTSRESVPVSHLGSWLPSYAQPWTLFEEVWESKGRLSRFLRNNLPQN